MIWGEITVLEFLVMSFYNYAKVVAVLSKREKSTVTISAYCPVPHLKEVVVIFPKKNRHPKIERISIPSGILPK